MAQPLHSTGDGAGPSSGAASAGGAAPGPALGAAASAPAGAPLKRLFSAVEQEAAAAESVRDKRIRALQRQGSAVDARTPLAQLLDMPPPPSSADAAALELEEAYQLVALLLPEQTADEEDADTRDLHAALLLSMMPPADAGDAHGGDGAAGAAQ